MDGASSSSESSMRKQDKTLLPKECRCLRRKRQTCFCFGDGWRCRMHSSFISALMMLVKKLSTQEQKHTGNQKEIADEVKKLSTDQKEQEKILKEIADEVKKLSTDQKEQGKMLKENKDDLTEIKALLAENIKTKGTSFEGPMYVRNMQICTVGSTNHYGIQGRCGKHGNAEAKAEGENPSSPQSTALALLPAACSDRSVRECESECDGFIDVDANCFQHEQARAAETRYSSPSLNGISDHGDGLKGCENSRAGQQVSSDDESVAEYDSDSNVDDRESGQSWQEDNTHEPDGTLHEIDEGGVIYGLPHRPSSESSKALSKTALKRATRHAVSQMGHPVVSGNANNPKLDMPGREAQPTVLDGSQTNADSEVGIGAVSNAGGGRETCLELDMTAKGQLPAGPQAFEKKAHSRLEITALLQDSELSPRFDDDLSPVAAMPDYGNDPSKGTSSPQGDKISPWPGLSSEMTEDTDSVVQLSDMRDQQSFSCQADYLNNKMGKVLVGDSSGGTAGHCLEGTERPSYSDDRSLSVVTSGSQQSVSALSIDSELVGSGVKETGGPPNPCQSLMQAGKGLKGLPQSSSFRGPVPMSNDTRVCASGNGESIRGVPESEPPFSAPLQGTDSEQINSGMNKIEDYLSDGFPDSVTTDAKGKGQFHTACGSLEAGCGARNNVAPSSTLHADKAIPEREGFQSSRLSHPVQEGDVEEFAGSVGASVPETGQLVSDFTETNKSPSAALSDSITNSVM